MRKKTKKKEFTTTWIFEAIDRDLTFCQKRMFGGLAAYLRGRMVMVLVEDPGEKTYRGKKYAVDLWDGVLYPTEKEYHAELMRLYPGLMPHPVLGKWLYLAASLNDDFETRAREIAERISEGDDRLGVEPRAKKIKRA